MNTQGEAMMSTEDLSRKPAEDSERVPCRYWTGMPDWFEGHPLQEPLDTTISEIESMADQHRETGQEGQAESIEMARELMLKRLNQALEDDPRADQAASSPDWHRPDLVGDGYDGPLLLNYKQVAKILSIPDPKDVYELPIPRVRVSSGRVRWRAADVKQFIEQRAGEDR